VGAPQQIKHSVAVHDCFWLKMITSSKGGTDLMERTFDGGVGLILKVPWICQSNHAINHL